MKQIKKVSLIGALVLIFGFTLIGGAGCKNTSSANPANDDVATPYTIKNNSSYTVTLWDSSGAKTLEPGQQLKAWFDSVNSIYNVRYAPADKVEVVGSGLVYELVDKQYRKE